MSTHVEDSVRAARVYKNCPIIVLNIVTHADLIELTMLDFDIIFCIDFLRKGYATIDYQNRVVSFRFPNELELKWKGRGSNQTSQIISNNKANKMLSK